MSKVEYNRQYYLENRERILKQKSAYWAKNKETKRAYDKQYRSKNRKKITKSLLKYRNSNPMNKLSARLRTRLFIALTRKSWMKNVKFNEYIGCSLLELKNHLETQFKPGMTWENHTLNGWHVDHIVPLNSAKTKEELYKLCHYSNLQPLWANENWSKSDEIG